MEGSKLTAGEAEFLTERLQLVLLSLLPESDRYRALDGALRKLRTGKSEVDFTDDELRQVRWELEDLRLEAEEHRLRASILRKLGGAE
jgi:hypothetical protein